MRCPKCKLNISDETGICDDCGFDVNIWDKEFKEKPKPVGYVNDFANLIQEDIKNKMEEYIKSFFENTGAVIIVATVNTTKPLTPQQYVFWLFNEWGIGGSGNKGILLLLALQERRIESEVGYGLEHIITDENSGEVLDKIVVPYLKDGKHSEGLFEGVKAIAEIMGEKLENEPVLSTQ